MIASAIKSNDLESNVVPLYQPHKDKWRVVRTGLSALSPRELEIVKLTAEVTPPAKIANVFGVSISTVRTHRLRAMKKLGVCDIPTLIHFCFARGLVTNLYANEPNG